MPFQLLASSLLMLPRDQGQDQNLRRQALVLFPPDTSVLKQLMENEGSDFPSSSVLMLSAAVQPVSIAVSMLRSPQLSPQTVHGSG